MAILEWDKVGERVYQTGVDRGVLYLSDGTAVPWNGLTGVEDTPNSEVKSYYLDGVKFLESFIPGDYEGKLKAFTYPDEFEQILGNAEIASGLTYHDQPAKKFGLSYRTKIGNDVDGNNHGYKLHLLYNLFANPDSVSFETLGESVSPNEFGWTLSGTPQKIHDSRPTAHISIDSRDTNPEVLQAIEDLLYGTAEDNPRLPSIFEVAVIFGTVGALVIIDNGDGTWTASDASDDYITMLDATTFLIENANATYSDPDTYTISDTI